MSDTTPKILMVCLGNICRSPMAEGVLKHKAQQLGIDIQVDSAGTSDWHEGEQPDERAQEEMRNQGLDISNQRARPFVVGDFDRFDHILVMDTSNQTNVLKLARGNDHARKVSLMLNHGNSVTGMSVPDPYYGDGFNHVFELLDFACDAFLKNLK